MPQAESSQTSHPSSRNVEWRWAPSSESLLNVYEGSGRQIHKSANGLWGVEFGILSRGPFEKNRGTRRIGSWGKHEVMPSTMLELYCPPIVCLHGEATYILEDAKSWTTETFKDGGTIPSSFPVSEIMIASPRRLTASLQHRVRIYLFHFQLVFEPQRSGGHRVGWEELQVVITQSPYALYRCAD